MRILIYGINYAPELTGIGKYTGEMAEWFATQGHDVNVLTAMPYYPEWSVHPQYKGKLWHKELKNGVKIYRCPLYVPKQIDSKKRIIHELSFLWSSSFYWLSALFGKKYDLVINICPPFHVGFSPYIYSKLRKTTLVTHVQDLQIDAAKDLNMLSNAKALDIMFKIERLLFNNSNYVSTLTSGMRDRIERKGVSPDKLVMLPNWVDTADICPLSVEQSLRKEFDIPLEDKVVLYSGNMGEKQGLDTLIEVAELLREQKNIHFVLVGSGAGKDKLINMVADKQLENVKFFPLQPYDRLSALLAMADVHLVLQKKSASDLVMPSKLTGILAAGGCSIVTATHGTSLYEIVEENNMGILCEPESVQELKMAIEKALYSDTAVVRTNARTYAENYLNKDKILSRFLKSINL